ncbi:MAG: AI-2E family transporter [Gammaproteobacteria bacterium]|jgi:putative permease
MFEFLSAWYRRYLSDPQASLLLVLLAVAFVLVYFLGSMLAPLLAAIIIAYLLEGAVSRLERHKVSRLLSVNLVFLLFVVFMVFMLVVLLPLLSQQASELIQELPGMINKGQALLMRLPKEHPEIISEEAVREVILAFRGGISQMGQGLVTFSLASIPAIIAAVVYLVLVPLMIFFLLKDKAMILLWLRRFLPANRHLMAHLWEEMDAQIGNYIRGKVYEIIIVGVTAYVVFQLAFDLNYAPLLALTVGLSVLIPYIGAAVVTIPVALVGYLQFGWGGEWAWLIVAYLILQFLDGNILVPILFSDVVNLHPIAIIVAILVFGGLWGFWGVFFAIPLATLVKALIHVWPTTGEPITEQSIADSVKSKG